MKNFLILCFCFFMISCSLKKHPRDVTFKRISNGEEMKVPYNSNMDFLSKGQVGLLYRYITDSTWIFIESHSFADREFYFSKKLEDTIKGSESQIERFATRDYIYIIKAIKK